ncbi:MAG: PilZ domain-containing protein [Steroidobacteraceae bacterium]
MSDTPVLPALADVCDKMPITDSSLSATTRMRDPRRQMLEAFAKFYGDTQERSRFHLQITPGTSDKTFKVAAMGVLPAKRELIVSAPKNADGGLIAVYQGLTLHCQWFNASTLFRFDAAIHKVVFEPEPLLYLRLSDTTQRRSVRTVPRALVNLPAVVRTPQVETVLLVDLSVTGARIAILKDTELAAGHELELSVKPKLQVDLDLLLTLKCTVMGAPEAAHPEYPGIVFRGLKFNDVSERDLLIMHAYVQQSLVDEMDNLAHVLLKARDLREIKE